MGLDESTTPAVPLRGAPRGWRGWWDDASDDWPDLARRLLARDGRPFVAPIPGTIRFGDFLRFPCPPFAIDVREPVAAPRWR